MELFEFPGCYDPKFLEVVLMTKCTSAQKVLMKTTDDFNGQFLEDDFSELSKDLSHFDWSNYVLR